MRSSSTSSAMRLSRSANTLYAIVPRWLALARRVPRRPRARRRTCGSQGRLRWQAALARGCQGPWRWRVALARVAPGACAPVREALAGPARSGSLRSPSRAYTGASGGNALAQAACFAIAGDRLRCRFAHSEGCTGGRWRTAAGTRSRSFSPSLCCATAALLLGHCDAP